MIINLPKDKLNPTYAILSDTLVEAPNVENYLKDIVEAINLDAKKRKIPFEISLNQPNADTVAAMREAERIAKDSSVKGYTDLDKMFADLET